MMKSKLVYLSMLCLCLLSITSCGKNSRDGSRDLQTNIRIINAVADVSALDFYLDQKIYLQDVGYLENTSYSKEDSQPQKFQVSVSGTGTRLVDTTVGFSDNKDATLLIAGRKNDSAFLKLSDDNSPASDSIAKIRFIQAAYEYNKLDVYIVNQGQAIDTLPPTFSNMSYKHVTNYIVLDSSTYSIILTEAGSKVAVAQVTAKLSGSDVYSLLAVDTAGGKTPAKIVLLTDHS